MVAYLTALAWSVHSRRVLESSSIAPPLSDLLPTEECLRRRGYRPLGLKALLRKGQASYQSSLTNAPRERLAPTAHSIQLLDQNNMDHPVLPEATVLSHFPQGSRIISPSARTFIKESDGQWWNWSNNTRTNRTLQAGYVIPPGSKAYYPHERRERYVKHPDGRWLSMDTQRANEAFAPNTAVAQSAGHHGAAITPVGMQIIPQETYHNGPVPANDTVVVFNALLSSAARGDVADKDSQAFTGQLAVKEKISIRFGFTYIGSSDYKAKQHNLRRGGLPLTRGYLAMIVAEEVRKAVAALAQINVPIARSADGRQVALEDLMLVDVKRVSDGTLQPTIAVRSA